MKFRGKLAGGDFSEELWQPSNFSLMTTPWTMGSSNCGLRSDHTLGLMATLPTEQATLRGKASCAFLWTQGKCSNLSWMYIEYLYTWTLCWGWRKGTRPNEKIQLEYRTEAWLTSCVGSQLQRHTTESSACVCVNGDTNQWLTQCSVL